MVQFPAPSASYEGENDEQGVGNAADDSSTARVRVNSTQSNFLVFCFRAPKIFGRAVVLSDALGSWSSGHNRRLLVQVTGGTPHGGRLSESLMLFRMQVPEHMLRLFVCLESQCLIYMHERW